VPDSRILRGYCGVIKPSNLHPPFVLSLRLMPRPIIIYEEGSGDRDNLGVVPRTTLSSARQGRGGRTVIYRKKNSLPKHSKERDKYNK